MHKWRNGTSLSATSIGTEENSLGVLGVHDRALIYTRGSQYRHKAGHYKYKETRHCLVSSCTKGDTAIKKLPENR